MMPEEIHQRPEKLGAKLNPGFMEFSSASVPGILCPEKNPTRFGDHGSGVACGWWRRTVLLLITTLLF
jgi:hypothetical protein